MTQPTQASRFISISQGHDALHTQCFAAKIAPAKIALQNAKNSGSRKDVFLATLRLDGAKGMTRTAQVAGLPTYALGEGFLGTAYAKSFVAVAEESDLLEDEAANLKRNLGEWPSWSKPVFWQGGLLPHVAGGWLLSVGAVYGGFIGGLGGAIVGGLAGLLRKHDTMLNGLGRGAIIGGVSCTIIGAFLGFATAVVVDTVLGGANLALRGVMMGIGAAASYGYGVAAGAINAARHRTPIAPAQWSESSSDARSDAFSSDAISDDEAMSAAA